MTIVMTIMRAAAAAALMAAASSAQAQSPHPPPGTLTAQLAREVADMRRPTVCTKEFVPVCGRLDNRLRTFPNRCSARAAGADVIAQGPCGGEGPRSVPR